MNTQTIDLAEGTVLAIRVNGVTQIKIVLDSEAVTTRDMVYQVVGRQILEVDSCEFNAVVNQQGEVS